MDHQTSTESATPKRPTFLTVLCILTFLGSGYGIVNNLTGFMNADKVPIEEVNKALDSARSEIAREAEGTPGAKVAEKVFSETSKVLEPSKMKKMSLYLLMANILTFGGAYLMYQLRKQGFWMYLFGTGLAVATPLIIFGASNLVSMAMTVIFGFIGVVFAILYAMNLKHMS